MENKVIFIILTIILVITLVFNIILLSKRVSKTAMYFYELERIYEYEVGTALLDDDLIDHKIRNRGILKIYMNLKKICIYHV